MKLLAKILFIQLVLFAVTNAYAIDFITDTSTTRNMTFPFFGTVACKAYNCFLGSDVTIAISSVAIFSMGIMALIGRMQWNTVIVITAGMVLLSSAAVMVEKLNSNPVAGIDEAAAASVYGQGCPSNKALFTCN